MSDTVLRALLEEFDGKGRALTWEVATQGLAHAAFEIKQMALVEIGRKTKEAKHGR